MNFKKIKVLYFIPNLTAGGAERVMLSLARDMDSRKFQKKLVVLGFEKDSVYSTKGVNVIYLNHKNAKKALYSIFKIFISFKPDIVLGSLIHVNYVLGLISFFFPKTKCVARQTIVKTASENHTKQSKTNKNSPKIIKYLDNFISDLAKKNIDYLICQSKDMYNDLLISKEYPKEKLKIINNPVSSKIQVKKNITNSKTIQFITVGRLTSQKGYERILSGLSKITYPFKYIIIGRGPDLRKIKKLIKDLELEENVEIIEVTTKVYTYLKKSQVYLMGSYFEGFPNALLESLAIGTPAIVYNAPGGINEIMRDQENGYLVSSDKEFVESLFKIKKELPNFYPKTVASHVKLNFSQEKVLNDYEMFFEKIVLDR